MKRSITCVMTSVSIATTLLLTGCATQNIKATKADAARVILQSKDYARQLQQGLNTKLVTISHKPFIATNAFKITHHRVLPHIFDQQVVYNTNVDKTLPQTLSDLSDMTGVRINLTQNATRFLTQTPHANKGMMPNGTQLPKKEQLQSSVRFVGSLSSLLNHITQHFALFWRYNFKTHAIDVFRTETKTFTLSLLPGSVNTQSTIESTGESTKSTVTYSNKKISPWQSALYAIRALGGVSLHVESDPTYNLVTVSATPPVLARIGHFVNALSKRAGKRVMIKVSVYDVNVSNETNYGLNWNMIYKATVGSLAWSNPLASAIAGPFANGIKTATFQGGILSGPFKGSDMIASAIQSFTDSTYVTGDTFVSLNGESNPISDVEQDTYLKQISVTTLGGNTSNSNSVEVSATPASLQTGYIFNITPLIVQNNKVRIHLSLDMSSLINMTERKLGSKADPETIDLPHTKHKKLIQTLTLVSGQTAVISGFTNDVNNINTQSLGAKRDWRFGGNQGTSHKKMITVIILTPYIIAGNRA